MKFDPKPFYRLRFENKREIQAGGVLWRILLIAEPRVGRVELDLHRYGVHHWVPEVIACRYEEFIHTHQYTKNHRAISGHLLRIARRRLRAYALGEIDKQGPRRLQPTMVAEVRRADFEREMFRRFLWLKDQGWQQPGAEGDPTMAALFWRTPDGQYGVQQFEAAWVGFNMGYVQRENEENDF